MIDILYYIIIILYDYYFTRVKKELFRRCHKGICLMDRLIYGCKKNFGYFSIYGVYSKYIL